MAAEKKYPLPFLFSEIEKVQFELPEIRYEAGKEGESVERFRFANPNFPAIMAILERTQRMAPS